MLKYIYQFIVVIVYMFDLNRAFLCGGSTGLFIYGYCLYYYYARSDMSGFMQTSFFFGYMACICYGFFLMLGTVGFRAALFFVRHIYRSIKCEQEASTTVVQNALQMWQGNVVSQKTLQDLLRMMKHVLSYTGKLRTFCHFSFTSQQFISINRGILEFLFHIATQLS